MSLFVRALFLRWLLGFAGAFVCLGVARSEVAPRLYGLCAAYGPELEALKREFGVDAANGFSASTINGLQFWRGRYAGKEIVVFRTGVSLVNAAYQLQLALERFPITHVLFAGVAGGTDPALKIGDVVIPERWAYHSEAVYLNDDGNGGYNRSSHRVGDQPNFGMAFPNDVSAIRDGDPGPRRVAWFPVDPELLAAAQTAARKVPPIRKAGREVVVAVGGTGVAGTVFVDNAKYREWVFRVWQARCLDMESTALAHVAYANRKPILIVRGLSDLAGAQQGANPIGQNEVRVADIGAKVLRAIVDEL